MFEKNLCYNDETDEIIEKYRNRKVLSEVRERRQKNNWGSSLLWLRIRRKNLIREKGASLISVKYHEWRGTHSTHPEW